MELIYFLWDLRERKDRLLGIEVYCDDNYMEAQLLELDEVIELLQERIKKQFSRKPKLNQYVLYLYFIKNYSYKKILHIFSLNEEEFRKIITDFDESYFM